MKTVHLSMLLVLLVSPGVFAKEKAADSDDAKEISGMSIVGNDEAPKSLFIVPWKSSEIGFESDLTARSMLDGSLKPLDKEVFSREIDYFDIRNSE